MAMVYLKNHNENIYNIEREIVDPQQAQQYHTQQQAKQKGKQMVQEPGKYISKFRTLGKSEERTQKAPHRTMGYARTPLPPPTNFLKKNEGIRWRNESDHKCYKKNVPPVPRHNAPMPAGSSAEANKNLKMENIKKVLKSAPVRSRPRFVDSCNGTVHDLFSSGLMPQYIFRPTYGKVPSYISDQKRSQSGVAKRSLDEKSDGGQQDGGVKYVSQEERMALLSGLKENWQKLQKRYQGLPVLTDTEPKKIAKANLEKELKQLEQDIMLLEYNPHIYVCNNSRQ